MGNFLSSLLAETMHVVSPSKQFASLLDLTPLRFRVIVRSTEKPNYLNGRFLFKHEFYTLSSDLPRDPFGAKTRGIEKLAG